MSTTGTGLLTSTFSGDGHVVPVEPTTQNFVRELDVAVTVGVAESATAAAVATKIAVAQLVSIRMGIFL
jgi:hypothetical protein